MLLNIQWLNFKFSVLSHLIDKIVLLFLQDCVVAFITLCCLLLLWQVLHSGSFINHVLPLVELGFKSPCPQVKCQAFQAWKHLIENFALNPGETLVLPNIWTWSHKWSRIMFVLLSWTGILFSQMTCRKYQRVYCDMDFYRSDIAKLMFK